MKRLRPALLIPFIILLFSLVIASASVPRGMFKYGKSFYEKMQIFAAIIETLQKNYVDERTTEELIEGAITGMLSKLDPHTNYLPPDNYKNWNQTFEGYTGVGILFDIVGSRPVITGFVEGGPAARSNLKVGDIIIKIDHATTRNLAPQEIARKIINSPFSDINFTILTSKTKKKKRVKVKRTHIDYESVTGAFMLNSTTGYIMLERFSGTTALELDKHLDQLLEKGMRFLILDMRDNGGGYLSAAVEVADRFLPRNRLILYTQGRSADSYQEYRSSLSSKYEDLPLVILINHGTASAAEIVAGAMQDWDRAVVIGMTSFGKGLVQSQFRFRDGSALLLTTARYYTPLGRLIQRDYSSLNKDEYYRDAYKKIPAWPGDGSASGRKTFKTLQGRSVLEGGGITPDIQINNDSAEVSEELRALYLDERHFFYQFSMQLATTGPEFKKITPEQCPHILISKRHLNEFFSILRTAFYPMSKNVFDANQEDIAFLIQRDLAYFIAGNAGRFHVNFLRDNQLQVASRNRKAAEKLISSQPVAGLFDGENDPK